MAVPLLPGYYQVFEVQRRWDLGNLGAGAGRRLGPEMPAGENQSLKAVSGLVRHQNSLGYIPTGDGGHRHEAANDPLEGNTGQTNDIFTAGARPDKVQENWQQ